MLSVPRINDLYEVPHAVLLEALGRLQRDRDNHAAMGCKCGGESTTSDQHAAFSVGSSAPLGGSQYSHWHNRLHVSYAVIYEMARKKMVDDGVVRIQYCPTGEMVADALTKPLSKPQLVVLRPFLMGQPGAK